MRAASHNGSTIQAASDSPTYAAAMAAPPVKRSNASDAAPNAAVPSMARSAPVRAASTGLISVAECCHWQQEDFAIVAAIRTPARPRDVAIGQPRQAARRAAHRAGVIEARGEIHGNGPDASRVKPKAAGGVVPEELPAVQLKPMVTKFSRLAWKTSIILRQTDAAEEDDVRLGCAGEGVQPGDVAAIR